MRRGLVVLAVAAVAVLAPGVGSAATVSPTDRAAIDRLMDVFVPAAIGRVHSERAWPLSTPYMHLGSTRADWAKGTLPVQPFAVLGKRFHGWTIDSAKPGHVDVSLLVHVKPGGDVGAAAFALALKKVRGSWLVDSATVAATFAAKGHQSKILAANDFGPNSSPDPYSSAKSSLHAPISSQWLWLIPVLLVGLIVVLPIGIFTGLKVRDRRAYRRSLASRV
jgi:hypothetical protein